MKINELLSEMKSESNEEKVIDNESKYLTGKDKVAKISPVLGAKPKKQKALMTKFFGSDKIWMIF
jgi:hypothetical protein